MGQGLGNWSAYQGWQMLTNDDKCFVSPQRRACGAGCEATTSFTCNRRKWKRRVLHRLCGKQTVHTSFIRHRYITYSYSIVVRCSLFVVRCSSFIVCCSSLSLSSKRKKIRDTTGKKKKNSPSSFVIHIDPLRCSMFVACCLSSKRKRSEVLNR